jgi:hypothetical protein
MLSPAQITYYGRLWGRAAAANGWRMDRGRLQGRKEAQKAQKTDWSVGVLECWEDLPPNTPTLHYSSPGSFAPFAPSRGHPGFSAVFALAEQHALANSRAVTVEDLRRACTAHAAGRFCSTKDLTNAQFDSLLSLLKLLADETDIGASVRLDHPDIAIRERYVLAIRKRAPEAKLVAIARNLKTWAGQWEPPHWEDLPIPGLKLLLAIVIREQKEWNNP